MKFIYILEDDERILKDLFETLKSIDPQLHIRIFPSLALFHEWLKTALQEGPKALATGGQKYKDDTSENVSPANTHQLRLVIAKDEFLGTQNMGLVKRAREFFLRKKMCTEQDPTSLVLTAFDSPDFDIALAEDRIISNVIFKPFDKLILKLHLEYALAGHHPLNTSTVASMKIKSTIEMLKGVTLNSISEIGFSTINNHEIKIGAMTKYYGDPFKTDDKKSIFAFCNSCKEIAPKEFLCEFLFFGADNKQIGQIRRSILQNKSHNTQEIKNTRGSTTRVLILDEDSIYSSELKTYLADKISNVEVYIYNSYAQLQSDLADKETVHRQHLPTQFDIVFANYEIFAIEQKKRWEQLCQSLQDRANKSAISLATMPALYIIAKKNLNLDEVHGLTSWVKNLFFSPLDKAYILKKLLSQHPGLLNKEASSIANMKDQSLLKVANPVEITQISEAGLVLKYYRPMALGSFREFILWRPEELETPEIIGSVTFTEKDKGSEAVLNHFVFFGMKDYFLKHIRLWLREAYIKTKDKG